MNRLKVIDPDLEAMTYLQQRRDILDLYAILRNTDLFREISEEDLKKIAAISTTRKHNKGDVLFQEKSKGDELFVVVGGCIAINKNVAGGRKRNLGNLRSGEIFGEKSLIDSEPRSADAEAIEDSDVIVIQNGKFLDLLKENCSLANIIQKKIISILCRRLRNTDEMLNEGVIWGFKMES